MSGYFDTAIRSQRNSSNPIPNAKYLKEELKIHKLILLEKLFTLVISTLS